MDLRRFSARVAGALFALTATLTAGCFTDSAITSSGAASADVTSAASGTESGATDSASATSSAGSDAAGESEGTSTSASTSDATAASTSTSDATGTTLPQPTTTDDPTTSTTDAPTTSGTTGGESSLEEACAASCEVFVQCTGADKNACLASCTSDPAMGPCLDARIETLKCIGDLSCMELQQPIVCGHQQSLEIVLCDDCSVEVKNEGTACAAHYLCTDHVYSITCEGDSCGCQTDGLAVGECALEVDLCGLGEDDLLLEAAGCCTWYQGD